MNYFVISSLQGVFQIPKDSSGLMKRLDVFPKASCASPVPHQGLTKTKKREALEHFAHFEIRMQRKESSSRCTSCVDSLDQVIRRRELFQFEEQLTIHVDRPGRFLAHTISMSTPSCLFSRLAQTESVV